MGTLKSVWVRTDNKTAQNRAITARDATPLFQKYMPAHMKYTMMLRFVSCTGKRRHREDRGDDCIAAGLAADAGRDLVKRAGRLVVFSTILVLSVCPVAHAEGEGQDP